MRNLYEALPPHQRGRWTEEAGEMVTGIAKDLDAGDVVMAKGSLTMGMARVVDAIKKLGHPAPNVNEGTS
jgi:UDP-N-acetylmuramoyl-tripeptide--D-alanyl-D-alanine ligase